MGMYRKILIAYDGSDSSKNALRQAIRLAEKEHAWIKVIAVVPSYEGELDITAVRNLRQVLEGPAKKLLAEAHETAKSEGAAVVTNLEQGEAYDRIVHVAEDENCELIVMGRRGLHRLERAFMGSVTQRVIGHSKKDILVVPRDTTLSWENLVLATDGSKFSEAATERAIGFAASYGGSLSAIAVVDVTEEFYTEAPNVVDELINKATVSLKGVKSKADALGVKTATFIKEGEAFKKITELASEQKAGLIFMGSHGRTGLKRLLMGSVTEKVIGHAPCPVLVVKANAGA